MKTNWIRWCCEYNKRCATTTLTMHGSTRQTNSDTTTVTMHGSTHHHYFEPFSNNFVTIPTTLEGRFQTSNKYFIVLKWLWCIIDLLYMFVLWYLKYWGPHQCVVTLKVRCLQEYFFKVGFGWNQYPTIGLKGLNCNMFTRDVMVRSQFEIYVLISIVILNLDVVWFWYIVCWNSYVCLFVNVCVDFFSFIMSLC
jgi:hypothetical protein